MNININSISDTPVTDHVWRHIEAVSGRMVGHCNFTRSDLDDLRQELALAVVKAFHRFNPEKGSYSTFAQKVIRDRRNEIMRSRIRCHEDTPMFSLDDNARDEEGRHHFALDDMALERHREEGAIRERREAVREIIMELPETARLVCRMIMERSSRAAILKSAGISKRGYYALLAKLRGKFSDTPVQGKKRDGTRGEYREKAGGKSPDNRWQECKGGTEPCTDFTFMILRATNTPAVDWGK